jgi:hypothetical protein
MESIDMEAADEGICKFVTLANWNDRVENASA